MKHVIEEGYESKKSITNLLQIFLFVCAVICIVGSDISVAHAATKLNMTNCTLFVGDYVDLKVTGYKGNITWKSSNTKVASVFRDGSISAKKVGKTVITAKCGRTILKCRITVLKEKKYSYKYNGSLPISLIDSEAYVGDMLDFCVEGPTMGAIYRRDKSLYGWDGDREYLISSAWDTLDDNGELITWSSSNENVAKVTQEGLVFFNKPGYVTITAKTKSNEAKVGFNVRSAVLSIAEKRKIINSAMRIIKKQGAKKVTLGIFDQTERWPEYEESAYSQLYGGKQLSKSAYLTYYGQTDTWVCDETMDVDDFGDYFHLDKFRGETVTIYYNRGLGGGMYVQVRY